MKIAGNQTLISPSDLVTLHKCDLAFTRKYQVATAQIPQPPLDEFQELLFKLGAEHELRIKDDLQENFSFIEIPRPQSDPESLQNSLNLTLNAMRDGIEIIYQGTLYADGLVGYPDFLKKVISPTGEVSYEPIDAKSATTAKTEAIIQTATYAYLLDAIGLPLPNHFHLWLAGDKHESFLTTTYLPIVRQLIDKAKLQIDEKVKSDLRTWADKRTVCAQCEWSELCQEGREKDRDLSLVQGIRSDAITKLRAGAITTIDQLAVASTPPLKLSKDMFEKLRDQAALQIRAENIESEIPLFEIKNEAILQQIPSPDPGDVYFDIEGYPLADSGVGLEYLLGVWFVDDTGIFRFKHWWAENTREEKNAFENFIDWVVERRKKYPKLHIYHYASYEKSAIRRLAGRHNTRIDEVDLLLSEGVLFDYYATVRQGLRLSTRSLSIKDVEAIYGVSHSEQEVSSAADSVLKFHQYLALRSTDNPDADSVQKSIIDYNELDVKSLQLLNDWIRGIEISPLPTTTGEEIEKPEPKQPEDNSLYRELMSYVPENPAERNQTQRAIAMVAALVEFQDREEKPTWWEFFDYAEGDLDEWGNDGKGLEVASATIQDDWHTVGTSKVQFRRLKVTFDTADLSGTLGHNPVLLYATQGGNRKSLGKYGRSFSPKNLGFPTKHSTIEEVHKDYVIIVECAGATLGDTWLDLPIGAIKFDLVNSKSIKSRLQNIAEEVLAGLQSGTFTLPTAAWSYLLLQGINSSSEETQVAVNSNKDDIIQALLTNQNFSLGVQGPPGTGKTYTGSRVIEELVRVNGWKVLVCSQSNAAIDNVLKEIQKVEPSIAIAKENSQKTTIPPYYVSNLTDWMNAQNSGFVVGATIFNLTKKDFTELFDLVVIEEAGQFSLAHSIAVLSYGKRGLLLGDPQQLPQVSQGYHPEPVHESALSHLLQDHPVIPESHGYFLGETFRMHPSITDVVSRLQYLGQLKTADAPLYRHLEDIEPGVHAIAVSHKGNRVSSTEEADEVLNLVNGLIGKRWKEDKEAEYRELTENDIIVVTPYNSQRRLIESTLSRGDYSNIRVGTVDKFQGQEAPVVIVSFAASSDAELPRGLDFLFSPNRINVAVSRAQWSAFILFSSELLNIVPTTPNALKAFGGFLNVVTKNT